MKMSQILNGGDTNNNSSRVMNLNSRQNFRVLVSQNPKQKTSIKEESENQFGTLGVDSIKNLKLENIIRVNSD